MTCHAHLWKRLCIWNRKYLTITLRFSPTEQLAGSEPRARGRQRGAGPGRARGCPGGRCGAAGSGAGRAGRQQTPLEGVSPKWLGLHPKGGGGGDGVAPLGNPEPVGRRANLSRQFEKVKKMLAGHRQPTQANDNPSGLRCSKNALSPFRYSVPCAHPRHMAKPPSRKQIRPILYIQASPPLQQYPCEPFGLPMGRVGQVSLTGVSFLKAASEAAKRGHTSIIWPPASQVAPGPRAALATAGGARPGPAAAAARGPPTPPPDSGRPAPQTCIHFATATKVFHGPNLPPP